MAVVLSVSVNGTVKNPSATAVTIGIPNSAIQVIEPFVGNQPIAGVTILTAIKMQHEGTKVGREVYLSPTATATVITAAG